MGLWPLSDASGEQAPSGLSDDAPLYAVVVVHTSLRRDVASPTELPEDGEDEGYLTRAFHYLVPEPLRSQVALGQLVWVPFGPRFLQGLIVDFDDSAPVSPERMREIERIVEPQPVLSPVHVELAHWISEYYLAPIHRVMLSMLPPGVTQSVEIVVRAVPDAKPEDATEAQARILALLADQGAMTLRQLGRWVRRQQGLSNWRGIVGQLVAHGWATRRPEVRPPKVRPKLVPVVRAEPGASLDDLSDQACKQRQALAHLLARRGSHDWIPLATVRQEADVSSAVVAALVRKGLVAREQRQVWRDPLEGRTFVPVTPPRLTPAQQRVWERISRDLDAPQGKPFLLQGVTGSGKTEIYLRAVARVLEQGRGAIVLVPEIALTPQTIRRFGARFPSTLAVMHSQLSDGERYDQWRRIRSGELRLVVGPRSAVFAPVHDLGLIVLDEEHEWTYKQESTPHYHAREVAQRLSALSGATCILGSATPALESAYRAERGRYVRLTMPRRIMGHRQAVAEQAAQVRGDQRRYRAIEPDSEALYADLPPVQIVDMRAELRAGNSSMFSRDLQRGMAAALGAGQQVILFLNRRGAATFVMCRDCGHVLKCPRCDVPLTYHSAGEKLVCHHCNRRVAPPSKCPACYSRRIRYFGAGTQRVEALAHEMYPQARIVRWDADTTEGKTAHEEILDQFISGEADIMVGTQMVAKGLDLPQVTLVGVVTADTILNLPDFRAGERTFQLLTQVAGRAGRSVLGGQVIIQTYTPEHPAIQAASQHDYDAFYEREIAFRREHWYPPLSRIIKLVYVHTNRDQAEAVARELHGLLSSRIARLGIPEVDLIGPAPAFFARERGRWRWQLLVRGREPVELLKDVRLPLGWRVDVAPVSLL